VKHTAWIFLPKQEFSNPDLAVVAVKAPDAVVCLISAVAFHGITTQVPEYVGTRIRLQARLDNVRQTVQIDFGVGDAVHPQPQVVDYPVLLTSPPVRLNAYPVEAAIAEKCQAMVHLDLGDPCDLRSSPDQRANRAAPGVDGRVILSARSPAPVGCVCASDWRAGFDE